MSQSNPTHNPLPGIPTSNFPSSPTSKTTAPPPTMKQKTFFSLPSNAQAPLVIARRPFTFLFAVVFSLSAFLLSLFYAVTGIRPPAIECPRDEPRTRPRPSDGGRRRQPAKSTSRGVIESLTTSLRRRVQPLSPLRGLGLNRTLEKVGEEDEEEEEDTYVEDRHDTVSMESLIRDDGSESDGPSEVDTVEDDPAVYHPTKGAGAGGFLKRKFANKRGMSESSSLDEDGSTSATSSTKSSRKGLCGRQRSMRRARTTSPESTPNLTILERRFSSPAPTSNSASGSTVYPIASTSSLPSLSSSSSSASSKRPSLLTNLSDSSLHPHSSSYAGSDGSISPTASLGPAITTKKSFSFFRSRSSSSNLSTSAPTSRRTTSPTPSPTISAAPSPTLPPTVPKPRRPKGTFTNLDDSGKSGLNLNDMFKA